jgi:hypothetical protein
MTTKPYEMYILIVCTKDGEIFTENYLVYKPAKDRMEKDLEQPWIRWAEIIGINSELAAGAQRVDFVHK